MCRGLALPYSLSGAVNSPIPDTRDAGISPRTAPTRWPRSSCSNKVYKYQSDQVHIARSQPESKNHCCSSTRALGLLPCKRRGNRKGLKTYIKYFSALDTRRLPGSGPGWEWSRISAALPGFKEPGWGWAELSVRLQSSRPVVLRGVVTLGCSTHVEG